MSNNTHWGKAISMQQMWQDILSYIYNVRNHLKTHTGDNPISAAFVKKMHFHEIISLKIISEHTIGGYHNIESKL